MKYSKDNITEKYGQLVQYVIPVEQGCQFQKLYNITLIIKFCKLYSDPVKQVSMTMCAKLDTPQG